MSHERTVYNIMGLLAEFGGLFSAVSKIFAILGLFVNYRVHTAKMINEMYFLKLSNNKQPNLGMWKNVKKLTRNLNELTFSITDMFTEVKKFFCQVMCCRCGKNKHKKYLNRTEKIFLKGFYQV